VQGPAGFCNFVATFPAVHARAGGRIIELRRYLVAMDVRYSEHGIHLPAIDLWLDPAEDSGTAWLSHAHADHARGRHGAVLATAETLGIYALRHRGDALDPRTLLPMPHGTTYEHRGARLSSIPGRHILGAAQLLVEYEGERLVYTGDIKLHPPLCGAETQLVPCDHLIVESTFGLPIFHLLDREEAKARIVRFARSCLDEGETPVFLGYALGRGQEIAHVLCTAGIPTAVHGSIGRLVPFYEAAGYDFPGLQPYEREQTAGKALVVVPSFRNVLAASGKGYRFAYVSGWAALANARARTGAEELIPWSDHADFDELLGIVEGSRAARVDVVHGYAEAFSRILRQRGHEASAPREAAARTVETEEP
jgi:Cft2 family RNA processing exonuclease